MKYSPGQPGKQNSMLLPACDSIICSAMDSGTKMLLLVAALHCWNLQAAETQPEVHLAELKIREQKEHRRFKREQFCEVWCLPNWILYNYTCYRVFYDPRDWVNAEMYCQQLVPGGHLASLHSLETSEFLVDLSRDMRNAYHIWVGASEIHKPDIFLWTDGSQWDYFKWQSGSPAGRTMNLFCVQLLCAGPDVYKMKSAHCSQQLVGICEYQPEFD
ncbi:snaclec alboaggregin-A subunit beta'-like [Narcine bancroftii]|uniref:snaclec alboaggregin-A subunit beta'-like n=1 Tax=Narcine bancroftii TaxID=1343680 RepID=UPI00383231A9